MIALAIFLFALSPGCIRPVAGNGTITGPGDYDFSLVHDNLTRYYRVHVPPAYDGETSTPMVIYIHGGGGDYRSAEKDGMYPYADKYGFILAAPAGTGPLGERLLSWNGGNWDCGTRCGYAHEHNIDDVGFFSQMIDDLEARLNVDRKRIYATGISNGALMTNRLACDLSDRIAAFAPVAFAAAPSNCTPKRAVPIMYIHGTADPCSPFYGAEEGTCVVWGAPHIAPAQAKADFWREMDNCSANYTISYKKGNATCMSYSGCAEGVEMEFCKVEGMGHAWPSGAQYLPPEQVGPVSYDISFDQMWDFFSRNPMR